MLFLGVDCGTQGTKTVLFDLEKKSIIAQGYAPHSMETNARGGKEQYPNIWIDAFKSAFKQMVIAHDLKPYLQSIAAIGVSGQQHGLVVLDKNQHVIRPAKLWCDTETAQENQELVNRLGGRTQQVATCGLEILTGYTISKLLWLKKHEPENYQKICYLFLPHDYLNFYLTGEYVCEPGDSSGTGYYDPRTQSWNIQMLRVVDNERDLHALLPRLIAPHEPVGKLKRSVADELGLSESVIISSGGGDNMMGAIGSGNVASGVTTISLGTSGTVYVSSPTAIDYAEKTDELEDPSLLLIANFCSSHGGWLPLTCHMNVTSTTTQVQQLLGLERTDFFAKAALSPVGSGGIIMVPFLNGERVPNLPQNHASVHYLATKNTSKENLARAAVEGASMSVYYGYKLLEKAGKINQGGQSIRLIGGGAKSEFWAQLMADLIGKEMVTMVQEEVPALGAALQATWCYLENIKPSQNNLQRVQSLVKLVDEVVVVKKTYAPNIHNHQEYQAVYEKYLYCVNNLSA